MAVTAKRFTSTDLQATIVQWRAIAANRRRKDRILADAIVSELIPRLEQAAQETALVDLAWDWAYAHLNYEAAVDDRTSVDRALTLCQDRKAAMDALLGFT